MIATLAIFLTPLVIALIVGGAVGGLLDPGGRWITFETVPLGIGATIALCYAIGYFVPLDVTTWIILALGVAGLAVALVLRRSAAAEGGIRGILPGRVDLAVIGSGLAAGVLLLVPMLRLGFPTTIATSNNDGWSYAGFVNWLSSHALSDDVVASLARPVDNTPYFQLKDGFGCGFEMLATMTRTILGREPFEVVGPVNAFGAVIAVCGWMVLWRALRLDLSWRLAPVGALVALSPTAVMAYSQNFAPHFFSLCLVPYAVAATLRYMERPGARTLVPGVLSILAVVGVYPAVLPWLAMCVLAVALLVLFRGRAEARAAGGSWGRVALRRVAAPLGLLVVLAVAVGPYQAHQTWIFTTVHDDNSGFATFPRFAGLGYPAFGLGTSTYFNMVVATPISWAQTILMLGAAVAIGAAVVVAVRRPGATRTLVALLAAVAFATLVIFGRFASLDSQGYGMFKAIVSGATLFTGLAMMLLIVLALGPRGRWALVAASAWAAVWVGIGSDYLELAWKGSSGFRAADIEMGRALAALPAGASVLAGGAAEEPGSFQLRMMTAYFGTAGDSTLRMQGLGTSSSYVAAGGTPEAIPTAPWRYVVENAGLPSPVVTARRPVFSNAGYVVTEAPVLDVTRYGTGWLPSGSDLAGAFAWVSGPVTFVVSNRGVRDRSARLSMALQSAKGTVRARLSSGGTSAGFLVPADRLVPAALTVDVPAGETRQVVLDVPQGAPGQQVVRVQDIDVRVAAPAG